MAKAEKGSKTAKHDHDKQEHVEKTEEAGHDHAKHIHAKEEPKTEHKKAEKKHAGNEKTSNSTSKTQQFEWVDFKPKEIEEAIVKLANSGSTASEIGLILRDQYGIPSLKKVSDEKVQEVLSRHNLLGEIPEDLLNLIRKSVRLERHMVQNKKDMTAKLGLQLTVSKIRRLVDYYHKNQRLPKDWHYSSEKAALLTK